MVLADRVYFYTFRRILFFISQFPRFQFEHMPFRTLLNVMINVRFKRRSVTGENPEGKGENYLRRF
jgi:hypothetical protein